MKKRMGRSAVIILLPILLYGLVGPLEIYASNTSEFNFEVKDFYPYFVAASLLLLLIGTVILTLIPQKVSKYFEGFIFGFSFLSYIQNMFLNRKLMNADGSQMDWEALKGYSIGNLIFWIVVYAAILFLPLYGKKVYEKIYLGVSAFLCILQITAGVGLLISALSVEMEEHYALSGEKQYQAAAGQNTIIFILDHYSNGVFDSCRQQYPEMEKSLKDFMYYNNAECHYSYTFPSLSHILTGAEVDCSQTPEQWKASCWQEERCKAFYQTLRENGYECNFYSDGGVYSVLGNVGYLKDSFQNVLETEPKTDRFLLVRLFEKMTIYRYVPYILKPRFEVLTSIFQQASSYVVENGVNYGNVAFYKGLQEQGISINQDAENAFTVIHLEGLHGPRTTTAEAVYTDRGLYYDDEEPTPVETAKGLSIILNAYLQELKEIGVYEDATIIFTADHGDEEDPQPIFLIKEPGKQQDAMQVNSAPISLDDLQATVLELMGEDTSLYGSSIYQWQEDSVRSRESWFSADGFQIYTYETDRRELLQKIQDRDYTIEGIDTGWKHSW